MGINFSSNVSKSELFGAVLAGIGIWPTPSPASSVRSPSAPSNVIALRPHLPLPPPLRVTRIKDASPQLAGQLAGRMVISGRMADVCAELDRMVA
jgi:hypothetical protein